MQLLNFLISSLLVIFATFTLAEPTPSEILNMARIYFDKILPGSYVTKYGYVPQEHRKQVLELAKAYQNKLSGYHEVYIGPDGKLLAEILDPDFNQKVRPILTSPNYYDLQHQLRLYWMPLMNSSPDRLRLVHLPYLAADSKQVSAFLKENPGQRIDQLEETWVPRGSTISEEERQAHFDPPKNIDFPGKATVFVHKSFPDSQITEAGGSPLAMRVAVDRFNEQFPDKGTPDRTKFRTVYSGTDGKVLFTLMPDKLKEKWPPSNGPDSNLHHIFALYWQPHILDTQTFPTLNRFMYLSSVPKEQVVLKLGKGEGGNFHTMSGWDAQGDAISEEEWRQRGRQDLPGPSSLA